MTNDLARMRIAVVGASGGTHVGESLVRGAADHGIDATLMDTAFAHRAPWVVRKINWTLRDHRPARLRAFGRHVLTECRRLGVEVVVTTGGAPLDARAVRALREAGAFVVNYSTDDPFNPANGSRWLLEALAEYDLICTPRRANITELEGLGDAAVRYLPFAYDPRHAWPEPLSVDERAALHSEVLFVGGADADRVPYVQALVSAGVQVATHGGFWERWPAVRHVTRGLADAADIRRATRAADVSLCLVRRANRDGHVMRSYEIAATGACMLVEDTEEHRAIFGADGETVLYFGTIAEMVERARALLADGDMRARLAEAVRARITAGANTYGDRLSRIAAMARELMNAGAAAR